MNPKVIEAAAKAIEQVCPSLRDAYPDGPDYTAPRVLAESAITAALRELAPEIRAAVARLSNAAYDNGVVAASELRNVPENAKGDYFSDAIGDAVTAKYNAHRDLFARLGIPEDGA